jgi:hypothetical protein
MRNLTGAIANEDGSSTCKGEETNDAQTGQTEEMSIGGLEIAEVSRIQGKIRSKLATLRSDHSTKFELHRHKSTINTNKQFCNY